ncbi:MAG: hypothetical protein IRZ08_06575 [Frankia sp.]|nr:hypothetical protein [Frankia sp.]
MQEVSGLWKRLAVGGVALLVIAAVMATCARRDSNASDSLLATTSAVTSDEEIVRWYDSTLDIRTQIATSVAAIRHHLATQDGAALQPACDTLADQLTEARALPSGPDTATQSLFDAGLGGYGNGVTACGNLFDGTQIAPELLQEQVRAGLSAGDEQWAELATRVGRPMATASPLALSSPPATESLSASPTTVRPSATGRPRANPAIPPATATRTGPPAPEVTPQPSPSEPTPSGSPRGPGGPTIILPSLGGGQTPTTTAAAEPTGGTDGLP